MESLSQLPHAEEAFCEGLKQLTDLKPYPPYRFLGKQIKLRQGRPAQQAAVRRSPTLFLDMLNLSTCREHEQVPHSTYPSCHASRRTFAELKSLKFDTSAKSFSRSLNSARPFGTKM